jgi:hypothetical protein
MPSSQIARSTSPIVLNLRKWRRWHPSISSARRRRRAKRVEQLRSEDNLIGSQFGAIEEIEQVRGHLKS